MSFSLHVGERSRADAKPRKQEQKQNLRRAPTGGLEKKPKKNKTMKTTRNIRSLRSQGFTLIELLVVISIIAILAGFALPVFASAQKKGRLTDQLNNGKQIGTAMKMYAGDNGGSYPSLTM